MIRLSLIFFALNALAAATVDAQLSNLPADPFKGSAEGAKTAKDYSLPVDRARGKISLPAEDGKYTEGSHFANWNWNLEAKRRGRYAVSVRYTSGLPKIGMQVKVGDDIVLKGYAPRSGGDHDVNDIVVGFADLPGAGQYPVLLLTGDNSNGPAFFVKSVDFTPAPESDCGGQSIDGAIELHAGCAATFSETMRYEPKPEKDCLGLWTDEKDWAEWTFDVSRPGKFKVEVVQGCGGEGNAGSEVAVLVNDNTLKFTVVDTGGFQNWKSRDLGTVEIPAGGENKVAIKPLSKKGAAVMDFQKVVLLPVGG